MTAQHHLSRIPLHHIDAIASRAPEIDYEMNVLSAEANGRHLDITTISADDKDTNGKTDGSSKGKLPNKESRSRVPNRSLVKSKSDMASKIRNPPAGSRTVVRKSRFDQEEEIRKKIEELRIQRQKRIEERSAANGSKPVTSGRNSMENKASSTPMKNQPKTQETKKVPKPVLRRSTIERLATARNTSKVSSAESRLNQPKKPTLKTGSQKAKSNTNKAKASDKKSGTNKAHSNDSDAHGKDSNEITVAPETTQQIAIVDDSNDIQELQNKAHSSDSDAHGKDSKEGTIAPEATQQIAVVDDCKDILELQSTTLIVTPEENEISQSYKGNHLIEDNKPVQSDHVNAGDCNEDIPEMITVDPAPPSPNKTVASSTVNIKTNSDMNEKDESPRIISEIEINSTPPPPNEVMEKEPAVHSKKKWNTGQNSSKAAKGFRKLLFFGRKTSNSHT
ncbi:COP1-interacting protein 7, putative isoform 1 [Hibiscus syriacus]|uniref:COP1-interacting protein 7, putative isoform 1 n=2 Tax=Hibiscus syriacus TaxID=106335 RepID=A0A6A3AY58_HIBSY|nr:COP1-interacting protein 7, putative isoform 1 [Hibiscus syriacus]